MIIRALLLSFPLLLSFIHEVAYRIVELGNVTSLATKSTRLQLHENLPTLANALDYECSRSQPTPHSVASPFFLTLPLATARHVLETKI